ncbi:hypothetical protein [Arcticibacter sp.]|uniref:hypothetical protein n=1 Tax=Arcticibacter sp. TaxID=1872630 RepID=UPI00388ECFA3
MNELFEKNILLFCPSFFEYEKYITTELEDLGARVFRFDERPANDFFTKALIRVDKRVISRKVVRYYSEVLMEMRHLGVHIDYVLFVNPEAVDASILNEIKTIYKDALYILYMWDSFRNKKKTKELLPFFDLKYTFDPEDARMYGLQLRPLFFIKPYSFARSVQNYDLLFIGTAHSDRYEFVKKLVARTKKQLVIKSYFYLSSRILFLVKKLRDISFWKVRYSDISYRALSHSENANLMHQSKVILDINHPQQLGLTMRTFETIGSQRKLVTTNADIRNYDFYNENNVLILDRENPVIDEAFFDKPFLPYSSDILFKYSIKGWIFSLFNLGDLHKTSEAKVIQA